ncbi:MAG: CDP-alcohol phosphatidyltransferase family protein [Phycisphaerae bacterium]
MPTERLDTVDLELDSRRPLRAIALLPAAATLGNLLCGVLALLACLMAVRSEYSTLFATQPRVHAYLAHFFPTHIAIGAYLIVLAMIFDALDGRLARIARRTSEFGAQLDSIADIVSFGVAPVVLFITILFRPSSETEPSLLVSGWQWRLSVLCALVYVSCAAIRLARYNAENVRDESGQRRFSGLPTPGAAAAFTALLVLHEDLATAPAAGFDWAEAVRWTMALAAFALGLLMVSRLDYVHVFNVYVRREHPPIHLVWIVVALVIAWFSPQLLLVGVAYAYVLSGLVLNWVNRRTAAREKVLSAVEPSEN